MVFAHHGLGDVIMLVAAIESVVQREHGHRCFRFLVKSPLEADYMQQRLGEFNSEFVCIGTGLRRVLATMRLLWESWLQPPEFVLGLHLTNAPVSLLLIRLIRSKCHVVPYRAGWRFLFPRMVAPTYEHKVIYYTRFLTAADKKWSEFAAGPNPTARIRPQSTRPHLVIMAPGSGEREKFKRWPLERYVDVAVQLTEEHPGWLQIAFLGLPSELPSRNSPIWRGKFFEQIVPRRLVESQAAIARASVVVCGCTGTGHLAAAQGRPVVGIYGPTNPLETGPWSKHLYYVRRGYACSPCYRYGFTRGCAQPICMSSIPASEVKQAILSALLDMPPVRLITLRTKEVFEPSTDIISAESYTYTAAQTTNERL